VGRAYPPAATRSPFARIVAIAVSPKGWSRRPAQSPLARRCGIRQCIPSRIGQAVLGLEPLADRALRCAHAGASFHPLADRAAEHALDVGSARRVLPLLPVV
jgi:hypothetical protein